jgi:ComF family protein
MKSWIKDVSEALLHYAFPHVCAGCGSDAIAKEQRLCLSCIAALPGTQFHLHRNNPVEKIFWGRLDVQHATAQYYLTPSSLIHRLLHQFKYRDEPLLAACLGTLMGSSLAASPLYSTVDVLVPLPLFPSRLRKRGYNQSAMLCQGISDMTGKPVRENVVRRTTFTETQTNKNRVERWQNMEGRFELTDGEALTHKHVLLVDDVITTGATLEACGKCLAEAPGVQISVATLCYSTR